MKTTITLLVLFFTLNSHAQPGQLYFPPGEYKYTLVDDQNEMIQFRDSRKYRICIDDYCYPADSIPTFPNQKIRPKGDSLEHIDPNMLYIEPNMYEYPNENNNIHVNDFYIQLDHKPRFIKIVHKRDTMYLFQENASYDTLRFIPGYHYFPSWWRYAHSAKPKLIGGNYLNLKQEHFLVTKDEVDELQVDSFELQQDNQRKIEAKLVERFTQGVATVESNIVPLELKEDVRPYSNPQFDSELYRTAEENVYMALIRYTVREGNCFSSNDYFTRIDLNKNTMKHTRFKENPIAFGSSSRYFKVDTFNHVVYLRVMLRSDTVKPMDICTSWTMFDQFVFKSLDDGKSWEVDPTITDLFNAQEYYKFEFIDDTYAIGYKFQKIKARHKNYSINQGVYHLIKQGEIVDSFLTPDDVAFNNSNANYHCNRGLGDTIFLGSWGYNEYNYNASNPHHIYVVKKEGKWQFEIGKDKFKRSPFYRDYKAENKYSNVRFTADSLYFKSGARMANRATVINHSMASGLFILEHAEHIYLINTQNKTMYYSFDAGKNWLYHPRPFSDMSNMMLLEINKEGVISFFNRRNFRHESYRFQPMLKKQDDE